MDNASIHRSKQLTEYWQSNGFHVAYIPTSASELSPIDKYFSRLKHIVMKIFKTKNIKLVTRRGTKLDRKLKINYAKERYQEFMVVVYKKR